MEQIDAPISKNYSPLKFYLNDLERLGQVLADSCSAVTYETEGFRFTSVAELSASVKKARLETIHIKCEQPYVTIELSKLWARIYVASSKDKSAGVFYRLDQILSGSQRSLSWLYSYPFLWILSGALALSGVLSLLIDNRLHRLVALVLVDLVLMGWSVWAYFIRMKRHSTVILKRRQEQGSFVERNRDELAVAVIAAILGALLGVAGTILVTHFAK